MALPAGARSERTGSDSPGRAMPRIAVIGAGIVGAAIAFRLAERGRDVVLLDRAEPGSGVTSTTYAWVNANEKLPRAYFDLNVAAMEEYRRLAWRLAPAYWHHASGTLSWYGEADAATALAARVQRLTGWGYAAELLPASTVIADLEPGLRGGLADGDAHLGWFPGEAWVDAVEMTRKLVDATRIAGGRVLTGPDREVVAIAREGDARDGNRAARRAAPAGQRCRQCRWQCRVRDCRHGGANPADGRCARPDRARGAARWRQPRQHPGRIGPLRRPARMAPAACCWRWVWKTPRSWRRSRPACFRSITRWSPACWPGQRRLFRRWPRRCRLRRSCRCAPCRATATPRWGPSLASRDISRRSPIPASPLPRSWAAPSPTSCWPAG